MAAVDAAHILRRWLLKMPTHFHQLHSPFLTLIASQCLFCPFFIRSNIYVEKWKVTKNASLSSLHATRSDCRLNFRFIYIYIYILGRIISLIAKSIIHISTKWLLRHGLKTESLDGRHWQNNTHKHTLHSIFSPQISFGNMIRQ